MVMVITLVALVTVVVLLIIILRWRTCRRPKTKKAKATAGPMVYSKFVDRSWCKEIIAIAKNQGLRRSTVISTKNKGVQSHRTSTNTFLSLDEPAVVPFIDKVEKLLGVPRSHYEDLQVVRYRKGQEYKPHYDSCFSCTGDGDDVRRKYTVLVFLNRVPKGGGTTFPELDLEICPRTGTAIVWKNIDELQNIIKDSVHSGAPVCRGEKWACQLWIRDEPFR
jgi:prolyl 4-hydroxylase